jgi:mono/diheme cytochrome c family protein
MYESLKLSNSAVEFSNSAVDALTAPQCTGPTVSRRVFAGHWRTCLQIGVRCGLLAALALGFDCATMPRGATEANMARARNDSAEGSALFQQYCAGCHGERGESVSSAPRILGEGALPEYPRELNINADPAAGDPELLRLRARTRPAGAPRRNPFRSAQDLYEYVSKKMPAGKEAGSLSAGQYWAIVNFMLLAHGVQVPPGGVNEGNAGSVKLQVGRP